MLRKYGWPSATIGAPLSQANISITGSAEHPAPQLASQPPRICCYRNARRSREYALVDRLALEDPS